MPLPGRVDAATAAQWSGPAAFARFDSSAIPADALDPVNAAGTLFDQADGLADKQAAVFSSRKAKAKGEDPRAAEFAAEARQAYTLLERGAAAEFVGTHRDIIEERLLAVPRDWRDRVRGAVRRHRSGEYKLLAPSPLFPAHAPEQEVFSVAMQGWANSSCAGGVGGGLFRPQKSNNQYKAKIVGPNIKGIYQAGGVLGSFWAPQK